MTPIHASRIIVQIGAKTIKLCVKEDNDWPWTNRKIGKVLGCQREMKKKVQL